MKAVDGVKKLSSDSIKPIDNRGEGSCPCVSFIRCSSRIPYGQKVWSDDEKREQACGAIVYRVKKPALALAEDEIEKCMKKCNETLQRSPVKKRPYRNGYKTFDSDDGYRVMEFPKLNEGRIGARVETAKASMGNTADYTAFQKTMILRANLVKNGLALVSDIYYGNSGEVLYGTEKLTPFNKKPLGLEWNIDHIQTRGKGGCNRFCNAGLLSRDKNMTKGDVGFGCVCVDAIKSGDLPEPCQKEFEYKGGQAENKGGQTENKDEQAEKFKLYNCSVFSFNKENHEEHQPENPLGTMIIYEDLCKPDSPLDEFCPNPVKSRADEICG